MKKLNNKKGFTLAELLIVVAIIGVLTVVAVPIFTSQLEKSREATDIANLREAKAAAVTEFLENGAGDASKGLTKGMYFDVNTGKLVETQPTAAYGKGTTTTGDTSNTQNGYTPSVAYTNGIIKARINASNEPEVHFVDATTGKDL